MPSAARAVHAKQITQIIQAVAIVREHPARHRQGIRDFPATFPKRLRAPGVAQLSVKKAQVESGVVNQHLSVADKFQQLVQNRRKFRLAPESLAIDTVHSLGTRINVALRINVAMKDAPGDLAVDDLHATDFDDAVAALRTQASGLHIKRHLAGGIA